MADDDEYIPVKVRGWTGKTQDDIQRIKMLIRSSLKIKIPEKIRKSN